MKSRAGYNFDKNLSGFSSPCCCSSFCSIFSMLSNTFLFHTRAFLRGRALMEGCPVTATKNVGFVSFAVSKWIGHVFPDGLAYFKVKYSKSSLPYWGAIKWLVFIFWPLIALPCFCIGGQCKSKRILFIFYWLIWVPVRSTTPLSPAFLHPAFLSWLQRY